MGDNEGRRFHRPQMRALRMASAQLSTIAGVPQIAVDLLRRPTSAALGHFRKRRYYSLSSTAIPVLLAAQGNGHAQCAAVIWSPVRE
jgi:nitrate/nitrite transporter NarK